MHISPLDIDIDGKCLCISNKNQKYMNEMNDNIGNDVSSIEWFDDRIKNLYFFEKVVLGRAKNDSNFTEPEMVDMIGNINFVGC